VRGDLAYCGDCHAYAGAAEARLPELLEMQGYPVSGKWDVGGQELGKLRSINPSCLGGAGG
jgi:hypothetical protein